MPYGINGSVKKYKDIYENKYQQVWATFTELTVA
jgi:hypothetical protein